MLLSQLLRQEFLFILEFGKAIDERKTVVQRVMRI